MPCPYRSPAMPCRWGFTLCLSHLIYTVQLCLIHTCHAMPMLCSDHAILLNATAQQVRRQTACGLSALIRLLTASTRSSTKYVTRSIPISDSGGQCETKQRLSWTWKSMVAAHYKKDDVLNCWTSSSDISGYHADFHEGHGTIGAWHGTRHGLCELTARHGHGMGTAWARHGHGTGAACNVWIGLEGIGQIRYESRTFRWSLLLF